MIVNDNLDEALRELEAVVNAQGTASLVSNQSRRDLIQSCGYPMPIEGKIDESEE